MQLHTFTCATLSGALDGAEATFAVAPEINFAHCAAVCAEDYYAFLERSWRIFRSLSTFFMPLSLSEMELWKSFRGVVQVGVRFSPQCELNIL